jgi:hypothetical protein
MRSSRIQSRITVPASWPVSGQVTLILILIVTGNMVLPPSSLAQPPGPELFAKDPRTPLELWGAVDYLIRTGQAKKAVPYLDRFMKGRPDDASLLAIRDRFGPGSILQLDDDPATRPFVKPLADALADAARRHAYQPERLAQFVSELTKSPEEQDYAIRHLRGVGAHAVPYLVDALSQPDLAPEKRELLIHNIGRLDSTVIPGLVAVLASPDPALVAAAARALGSIGDRGAIPHLTFIAASLGSPPAPASAAREAIAHLTGKPFSAQGHTPVQVLTKAAWRYHRHQVDLPEEPVEIWSWDSNRKAPVPRKVSRREAEATLGLQLADEALRLDPKDHDAQVAQLSLTMEKAIEQIGWSAFPAKDQATFAAATASGPSVLTDVLQAAVAAGKADLAAAAAMALGQVTDAAALASTGSPHPLVNALRAPGRRVQLTAAKALVKLAPTQPFPGSSWVVPALARFVINQALPRAVVIDNNPNRGSQLAGFLINLGYDSQLEPTGNQGFRTATETADVELILISYDLFRGWGLRDTLASLNADARTAAIPVAVYSPVDWPLKHPNLERDYPHLQFLVQPVDADMLKQQLKKLPAPLTQEERAGYSREAVALLAQIAKDPKKPIAADLAPAEPALTAALRAADASLEAAAVLSAIPDPDAQRSLADLVLDPSQTQAMRSQAAAELTRSIQRFGPLMSADQEARLATTLRDEANPGLRAGLAAIVSALSPKTNREVKAH